MYARAPQFGRRTACARDSKGMLGLEYGERACSCTRQSVQPIMGLAVVSCTVGCFCAQTWTSLVLWIRSLPRYLAL